MSSPSANVGVSMGATDRSNVFRSVCVSECGVGLPFIHCRVDCRGCQRLAVAIGGRADTALPLAGDTSMDGPMMRGQRCVRAGRACRCSSSSRRDDWPVVCVMIGAAGEAAPLPPRLTGSAEQSAALCQAPHIAAPPFSSGLTSLLDTSPVSRWGRCGGGGRMFPRLPACSAAAASHYS